MLNDIAPSGVALTIFTNSPPTLHALDSRITYFKLVLKSRMGRKSRAVDEPSGRASTLQLSDRQSRGAAGGDKILVSTGSR